MYKVLVNDRKAYEAGSLIAVIRWVAMSMSDLEGKRVELWYMAAKSFKSQWRLLDGGMF